MAVYGSFREEVQKFHADSIDKGPSRNPINSESKILEIDLARENKDQAKKNNKSTIDCLSTILNH